MTNRDENKPDTYIDTPAVRMPPPLIVAVFLGGGLIIDYFLKTGFGDVYIWLRYVGLGLCTLGMVITPWCAVLYHKAKTSILPHTADSNMIDTGPFGMSRNPIYLSMLLVFVGVCFVFNAPFAFVFVIPTYLGLRYYVIAREEAYLTRRFGAGYTSYQSRVRRWI